MPSPLACRMHKSCGMATSIWIAKNGNTRNLGGTTQVESYFNGRFTRESSLEQYLVHPQEWGYPSDLIPVELLFQPRGPTGMKLQPVRAVAGAAPRQAKVAQPLRVLGIQTPPQCIQQVGHQVQNHYTGGLRIHFVCHVGLWTCLQIVTPPSFWNRNVCPKPVPLWSECLSSKFIC